MIDIDFIVGISNQGSLDDTIKQLERALQLQKDFGKTTSDTIKKVISDYNAYINKITDLQKKLQGANDVKQISQLTTELDKQKKALDGINTEATKLNATRKKSKELTDEELILQIRENEALNTRKKNIRDAIKLQNAMGIAVKTEAKSIKELKEQTNALVLVRDQMTINTKKQKKEFDELTKKINQNEQQLKKYDTAIGRSHRKVGDYSGALKSFGRNVLAVAGVTAGVSAVGSFLSQSTEDFKNFSDALQEIEAITGLTGKELDFFKDKALEAGRSGKVGARDYLEAVKLTGSARPELLKNKEALAGLVEEGILLSKASKDTLSNSIGALTTTLNAFNIPADRAREVVDGLAAASQAGVQEIPFLTEAFTKFGGVAATAGVSVAESAAAVEVLGIKIPEASTAGLQLKNILIILQKEAAKQKRPFEGLRKELDRYAGKVNDINFLTKTFKGENLLGIQTLIQQRKEFDRLKGAIEQTGTAQQQANANAKSGREESERLNRRLETLRIEIGEKLLPIFNGFKRAVIGIAEAIFNTNPKILELSRNLLKAAEITEKRLNVAFEKLREDLSIFELTKATIDLVELQEKFLHTSKETQKQFEFLTSRYNDGKISLEGYNSAAQRLLRLDKDKKKANKEVAETQGEVTAATDEGTEADKKASKALEDRLKKIKEFNDEMEREREAERSELVQKDIDTTDKRNEDLQKKITEANKKAEEQRAEERKKQREQDRKEEQRALEDSANDEERSYEQRRKNLQILYDKKYLDYYEYNQRLKELNDQQIADEKAKREKAAEETKEFLKNTLDEIFTATADALQKREELAEQELERQRERIDIQRELAQKGQENTLAFEEKLLAEKEKTLLEEQKKQERLKLLETYFNALSSYSKDDPNTAPAKALAQVFIAQAIAARLEEGGVIEEEVKGQGGKLGTDGVFKGASHKQGGIKVPLVEFEGEEGVLSKREMRNLGRNKFYHLKKALRNGNANEVFKKNSDESVSLIQHREVKFDMKPLENKLDEVKKAIDSKPVPSFQLDNLGNLIEKQVTKNMKKYKINKFNR